MVVERHSIDSETPENLKAIIAQQRLQIQEYKRRPHNPLETAHTEQETWLKEIQNRDSQIKALDAEIEILREALRFARMQRFAANSEKLPSDQSELFNEAEVLSAAHAQSEPTEGEVITVPAHTRARGKRKPLPDNLPREDVIIDLPEDEKICTKDGTALKEIGSDISEKIDIVPAKIKVIRTIRKKYVCPCCEDEANIKTAPLPEAILPKSNATAGLLAYIATSKYVDALPLYRLEQIFKRYAIELPRNTMARWMVEMTEPLLPVYRLMEEDLLAADYVCCDETRRRCLKKRTRRPRVEVTCGYAAGMGLG